MSSEMDLRTFDNGLTRSGHNDGILGYGEDRDVDVMRNFPVGLGVLHYGNGKECGERYGSLKGGS